MLRALPYDQHSISQRHGNPPHPDHLILHSLNDGVRHRDAITCPHLSPVLTPVAEELACVGIS